MIVLLEATEPLSGLSRLICLAADHTTLQTVSPVLSSLQNISVRVNTGGYTERRLPQSGGLNLSRYTHRLYLYSYVKRAISLWICNKGSISVGTPEVYILVGAHIGLHLSGYVKRPVSLWVNTVQIVASILSAER